jgi:hypothetical protein
VKQQLPSGLTLIRSQTQFGRFSSVRPFTNTTGEVDALPPNKLHVQWILKDGLAYNYTYAPLLSPEEADEDPAKSLLLAETERDALKHAPPLGYKGETGGRLWNNSTRPRTIEKALVI